MGQPVFGPVSCISSLLRHSLWFLIKWILFQFLPAVLFCILFFALLVSGQTFLGFFFWQVDT